MFQGKANLVLMFRYGPSGERVITGIERVSKSGRRIYVNKNEIPEPGSVVTRHFRGGPKVRLPTTFVREFHRA